MISLRDVVIFLAGAQFFHTISHIILGMTIPLPLDLKMVVLTHSMNMWAIVFNGITTIILIWWAVRLSRNK